MNAKRLVLTGVNGTLAPVVATHARAAGWEVHTWRRDEVSPEDDAACRSSLAEAAPHAIAHLAMGAAAWAACLARYAHENAIPFLFTSTAMVFHQEPDGPHCVNDARTAQDGYGQYKIACEDAVREANPRAIIARIGWQIHGDARGNNMLAHLDQSQQRDRRIEASRLWKPACSFMDDTAVALLNLIAANVSGTFHLDSNAEEGHTFDRIVSALKAFYERRDWQIEITEHYRHDQRLRADRGDAPIAVAHLSTPAMPPLSSRLPELTTRAPTETSVKQIMKV